jgi:hypothetical protein
VPEGLTKQLCTLFEDVNIMVIQCGLWSPESSVVDGLKGGAGGVFVLCWAALV